MEAVIGKSWYANLKIRIRSFAADYARWHKQDRFAAQSR